MPKVIAILGFGLIGSSVARAARACLPHTLIHAMDTDAGTLRVAREMKLADQCTADAAAAVRGADFIVLAAPLDAYEPLARAIAPHLKPGTAVTDVGSVKRLMVERILPLFPAETAVVPSHPIAGSEKSGVSAGSATLFAGKKVILTPPDPELPGVERVASFWEALRAEVRYMPAGMHDRVYGCVSHLPQYLSFIIKELYDEAYPAHEESEALRRFLRLGGSDKGLWQGIFKHNKDNLSSCLAQYLQLLHQVIGELREGEGAAAGPAAVSRVYEVLLPRVAASALIHVAHLLERELHVNIKPYAGGGFKDFTAPALADPDREMEAISGHAAAVAGALEQFALRLERKQYY